MYFTWNFLILLFSYAGLLWALPQAAPLGWWLAPLLFGLWLLDWRDARKHPRLMAERIFITPAYQNQVNQVVINITNPLRRQLRLEYKDEPPFTVTLGEQLPHGRVTVPPGGVVTVAYPITCPQRGKFDFGALNLKYPGVWRLYQQVERLPLKNAVLEVYPDLAKINQTPAGSGPKAVTPGAHRRRMLWSSGEFAQLREYSSGDDYRKINWNVTAHLGKPAVNEFEPEQDRQAYLLFDTGRLLFDQAAGHNQSRMDYILDSGLLLAYNIMTWGDRVGALSFNARAERYLPAGKGRLHLQLLVKTFFDLQPVMAESDYREAFSFWQSKVNKRCLLFVYTDLADAESSRELIANLILISRRHLVVCVLLRREYLAAVLAQPLQDEAAAYLKATAWELRRERADLIQLLSLNGIKVLEVTSANIRQTVAEQYCFLKRRGAF
jgi:uncharacterized protein (DUF58 family)